MQKVSYGPENPDITYVPHKYKEHLFDTGEVMLNYATTGSPEKPAVLLIPGQMESWWGYENAMELLSPHFQVFAVDLRGQGRSSRTPGRYTFDNFGNDLIKFIIFVIGRPIVISGLSSGGVISAWLSAYAPVGMIRGACYEDPPLFSCELNPLYGQSLRQSLGPVLQMLNKYLGDQWYIGDVDGLMKSAKETMPPLVQFLELSFQSIKEYDPEWGRAFISGSVGSSLDHARMLTQVKCPVLFTQHFTANNPDTGSLMGATSEIQAKQVERLVKSTGQPFTRVNFPQMGHEMHILDPKLFVNTIMEWVKTLPTEDETRKKGVFSNK